MLSTRKAMSFLGAMVLAAWLWTPAPAQESYQVGYDDATDVKSEIASLDQQIHDGVAGGYDCGGCNHGCGGCGCGCGDCGCGCGSCGCGSYGCGSCGCGSCGCGGCGCCCCDPCCRSEGLFYGGELAWLKPHHNAGVGNFAVAANTNAGVEPEFDMAFRGWVGFQRCDGLGFRTRYWQFDHRYAEGIGGGNQVFHSWDTWVWDVEMVDSTKLGCNWDCTFFGGFRYVDYYENNGITNVGRADTLFYGWGGTAGLELRRQLTQNLGVFTNLRWSVVMGEENDGNQMGATPGIHEFDNIRMMYEFQGGAEYIMPICGGGYYFVRAGTEIQYWDGFGTDGFGNGPFGRLGFEDNPAVGFAGFFGSVGVQR